MSERILEVEHRPGEELILRFRPPKVFIPSEARGHIKVARMELLLALRGLIDAAIKSMEKEETGKERTRIEVQ